MSKHWKDVKAAIEKDIDRIWFEEPEEVKMSRLGIFPSGAGSHDQVLGNLFFQACDTQAMGWWTPPFRPLCPMTPSVWSTASACGSI